MINHLAGKALLLACLTLGLTVASYAARVGKPCSGTVTQDEHGHGYNAVDCANNTGTYIGACHFGRLDHRDDPGGYGKYIVITHDNSYQSYYCHLSSRQGDGQNRSRNEKIGEMGSTGNSSGPHLHFEIRKAGVRLFIPAKVGNWWTRNDDIDKDYTGI